MINKHKQRKTINCPMCRQAINKEDIAYITDTPTEKKGGLLSDKSTLIKEKQVNIPQNEENFPSITSRFGVKGSYGTKIEAVIKALLYIKQNTPKDKTIVFSEWKDVLEIISHALTENNISFAQVKHKKYFNKVINQFQTDDTLNVILLTTKQGSNGLNLIEATNVILIEPLLHTAIEDQAINRVHRIGQNKETHVFRFIIANSIEEKIYLFGIKNKESTEWKKKQKDAELSISELKELFLDDLNPYIPSMETNEDLQVDETPLLKRKSSFWNTTVIYRGEPQPRHRVVCFLETAYSWEKKMKTNESEKDPDSSDDENDKEKDIELHGRITNSVIADRLLDLPEPPLLNNLESITTDIITTPINAIDLTN